ncbi:hypothetical protein BKA63DRAFT_259584 [Paraphoma chrysanthemicola]|nr:hypothetical protein BKA63DRAFT_259584 [Paraphoma chrysanthemicola]
MSSGVRNLRAMFENQGTPSSPEPRGRSPGDNTPAEPESRPTPKVRASFISVEPTGIIAPPDLGATKGTPANSAAAHRRESFSVSQDNVEEIAELKKEVGEEKEQRKNSTVIAEAVPEQAVASRESSQPAPPIRAEPAGEMPNLGAIMKGSDFPEPSTTEAEKPPAKVAPVQLPQGPAKKEKAAKKPAAAPKTADVPAPSQTPAKKENKPAVAPTKDISAQPSTPAKTQKKSTKAPKADVPAPAPTPAKAEVEEDKPAVLPAEDTKVLPEVTTKVEDKPIEAPAVETSQVPEAQEEAKEPTKDVEEKREQAVEVTEKKDELPIEAPPESVSTVVSTTAQIEEQPVAEPTPEPTALPEAPTTESESAPAPVVEASPENPDKVATGVQEEVSLKPVDAVEEASTPSETIPLASTEEEPTSIIPEPAAAAASNAADTNGKANGTPVAKTKPEIKKPTAISTAKASTSKVPAGRSPLPKSIPRTPTTPKAAAPAPTAKPSSAAAKPKPVVAKPVVAKPVAAKAIPKPAAAKEVAKPAAAKEPTKPAAPKTSRASLRPGGLSTATAPAASAATKTKVPAPEQKKPVTAKIAATSSTTSTSTGGFKKPAPKSPTRPVKLPSHLIAPTAASAAKHGEEAKVTRKPSTTTRPKAAAPSTKPSRPSIAPATAPKRPDSRASTTGGASKGDFLSRMMRPTAASASKTHDKPDSPPRKGTKAPVSALQKGKKKIEEVAAKAKDAVTTNGHSTEEPKAGDVPAKEDTLDTNDSAHTEAGAVASDEPTEAATPIQEPDSSVAEIQTPQFSGETVR